MNTSRAPAAVSDRGLCHRRTSECQQRPLCQELVVTVAPPEVARYGPGTLVVHDLVPESTAVPEDVSGPVAVGAVVPDGVVGRVGPTQKRGGDDDGAAMGDRRNRCGAVSYT